MSGTLWAVPGSLLVVLAFGDALATTVRVEGAGPLTRFVLSGAWRLLLRLHRDDTGSRSLSNAGPVLLLSTVVVWVLILWSG
ncbi:hypothetical protein [Kineococcus arenarius]|uniref:hypothetical protein n=1 Tax=unclassified Kineococcus TaxID=2621656 RepID=UPI003D7CD9D3